jgi:ATP-binding cassette subfamily B protein
LNLARLEDFVRNLPSGLQTRVGDGEKSLSGGQRQRIGIARALLTRPGLIVFDEATSSLDNRTEREITETLNDLQKRSTLIVIAHRFSTIQNVDKLMIIKHGQISDFGSKTKVLEANPDLAKYFSQETNE